MSRRFLPGTVLCLLAAGLTATAASQPPSGQVRKPPPAVDPASLVWPGPPEKPRVRFVTAISGENDVRGPVKLSFIERMAGRKSATRELRLSKPYGVAVDRAGRVYVADGALSAVVIFDRDDKDTSLWRGNGQFPLSLPMGLAIDGEQRVFVSDAYRGQIVVFSPEGRPVAGFGQGTLARPGGLAVDLSRRRLYVADAKLNRVFFFDTGTLALQGAIGIEWTGKPNSFADGMLAGPTNVAVDAQGEVYVVDTLNCRVQVFDPDGRFVRGLGGQGTEPGSFIRPKGIAIDSEGHVYVVDSAFNNFQIFTSEGQPLMFVGAAGEQPGQFLLPTGMFIDEQDRVYVTEQRVDGGRLQIFQYIADRGRPGG